ncbi:T9SS type A sorting domain-containing protein [Bizionia arctica]|uniref:Secretion system C-terminal sorting domain-containing protein n=1 Tax=Bizionia arctica TaxID=1495645 RepID=A0A917GS83_9FLAO|nr:T9SS type A sorting domain-containing protein [Bizionia arctica]GGG55424.1 hypothetical protein GCM10010976_27860 [Bizionia arctica]
MIHKLYIIIAAFLIANNLNAQFIGGSNDGSDLATLHGSKLNGNIGSLSVLYQGTSGDGHDAHSNQLLLAVNNFEIYHGSSGDGFSKDIASLTISGSNMNSLYYGNSGDGHSRNGFQSILNGQDLSILYKGNVGDGSDYAILNSAFLEGFITSIFNGGNGDGFSKSFQPDNYLSGLILILFNGGNGDGFAVDTFTSTFTLDLVEQLIKMNILLYPNPASHVVHLKPNEGTIIDYVELFDVSGKKIMINLSNNNTINVSNLSEGMYLLNIFTPNGHVSKKLIVKK